MLGQVQSAGARGSDADLESSAPDFQVVVETQEPVGPGSTATLSRSPVDFVSEKVAKTPLPQRVGHGMWART